MADNHVDVAGAGAGSSVKATTSSATDTSGGGSGSNGAASAAGGDTEDVVMEPQPANDDGDDDNDSDDSDDSDDDEVSEERVAELVAAVKAAPFDYGAHTSLVSAHRTNGDLFELRAARHAFADKLPLSEGAALPHRPMSAQPLTHTHATTCGCTQSCGVSGSLMNYEWLTVLLTMAVLARSLTRQWQTISMSPSGKCMHRHNTHTTPIRPPCSDHDQRLHIRYIDFACVAFGSDASNAAGLQRVRDIAARALDAAGLVLPNGQLLWAAARKLECALLEALESASYVSSPRLPHVLYLISHPCYMANLRALLCSVPTMTLN